MVLGHYDAVNKELFAKYRETHSPDGEIIFLAADPDAKIKGIGTMLLNELTAIEKGKTVYLYTDNACTYQFYEHRGFATNCAAGRTVYYQYFYISEKRWCC